MPSLLTLLACVVLLAAVPVTAAQDRDLARGRLDGLRRGINLSHWYAQSFNGYGEEHLSTHTTAEDFATIKRMGFDHVRLTLNDTVLFDRDNPGTLKSGPLAKFDERVKAIVDAGLNVIVDLHPEDDYKKRLKEPAAQEAFVADWRALARHLSSTDPERVYFEILNEPHTFQTAEWRPLQGRALAAIREVAPRHTVIAAPGVWSNVDELEKLEPYDDANVIYTIHWYDPFLFTHQGATWGWEMTRHVAGLPWPVEPSRAAEVAAQVTRHDPAAGVVKHQVGEGQFTEAWMARRLDRVAAWQREHGNPPVYVGEFGVYRKDAPADARLGWHAAARRLFEQRGWGWAMWDLRGGFGVLLKDDGRGTPDEAMREALGLK